MSMSRGSEDQRPTARIQWRASARTTTIGWDAISSLLRQRISIIQLGRLSWPSGIGWSKYRKLIRPRPSLVIAVLHGVNSSSVTKQLLATPVYRNKKHPGYRPTAL